MKSRKRISRKFIIGAGILAVFFALYLHLGLLPGKSKNYAIQKIEALTDKKVLFSKILYLPFEGLSFHDVKVTDKKDLLIFSAGKLAVNVRLIPFFTDKKIIIQSVYLDTPVYEFQTDPRKTVTAKPPVKTQISGQIDVPVVSDRRKTGLNALQEEGPEAFLPENVYLEQIEIRNGRVTVRNDASGQVLEEINSINLRVGFQKPPKLSFDGSVRLGRSPYATISLKGHWDLKKAGYEFYLDTKSDFIPPWLLDYQKKHFLILKESRFRLNTHLKSAGETLALFHAKAALTDAEILAGSGVYKGRVRMEVQGTFDFETRRFDRYRGVLDLNDMDVFHLTKTIDSLENLSGQIRFQPDLLEFVDVKGIYKEVPFQTDGRLQSFKELNLDETIRVQSHIQQVLVLVPENQRKLLNGFSFQGDCQAVTTVKGSLKTADSLKIDYKLHVENGVIANPVRKINADRISADILMNASGFKIEHSRFGLNSRIYSLEAFVPKKPEIPGALSLSSEDLRLKASYLQTGNSLDIKNARLEARGIAADFRGKAYDVQDLYCDVSGHVEIRLDKAAEGFSKEAPFLKTAGLAGTLKGFFSLKGLWNRPLDWELKLDAGSPLIVIGKKIRLTGFEMQAQMKNRILRIPVFRAAGYQGSVGGEVIFNLLKPDVYFNAKLYANEIDLHPFVRDLDNSKSEVAGRMILQSALSGTLGSEETFRGNGLVSIHDGRLFKTELFKSMGHLPFVRVEGLDLVEFTSLNASFTVSDKRVWTQDLRLLSETVDLTLEGSAGFDAGLDFTMDIRYSDDVIRGTYDTGGLVPFVVQQAENSISQYRVSGTLREPKYDKILI